MQNYIVIAPPPTEGMERMNSCKNRSNKEKSVEKVSCCGNKTLKGFECLKKNLFPLEPTACQMCNMYESRS